MQNRNGLFCECRICDRVDIWHFGSAVVTPHSDTLSSPSRDLGGVTIITSPSQHVPVTHSLQREPGVEAREEWSPTCFEFQTGNGGSRE